MPELARICEHDTKWYLYSNRKGPQKIEFQPWTKLDKKVIGVPLIYEANFENLCGQFSAQKLKKSTWSLNGPVYMFVYYCQTSKILILEGVYPSQDRREQKAL